MSEAVLNVIREARAVAILRCNDHSVGRNALAACGGNQSEAARRLGISRSTLISRLERYGVPRPRK